MGFSVLPGFAPAGEALLFGQKDPKPLTPHLALLEGTGTSLGSADQLASLKQSPPVDESVPPLDQTGGVGPGETNISVTHMKETEPSILYDPNIMTRKAMVIRCRVER